MFIVVQWLMAGLWACVQASEQGLPAIDTLLQAPLGRITGIMCRLNCNHNSKYQGIDPCSKPRSSPISFSTDWDFSSTCHSRRGRFFFSHIYEKNIRKNVVCVYKFNNYVTFLLITSEVPYLSLTSHNSLTCSHIAMSAFFIPCIHYTIKINTILSTWRSTIST